MNGRGVLLASLVLALGAVSCAAQEPPKQDPKPVVPVPAEPSKQAPMTTQPMPAMAMNGIPVPAKPMPTTPDKTVPAKPGELVPAPKVEGPAKRNAGVYTPLPYHEVYPPPAPVLRDPRTGAGRQQLVPPADPVERDIVVPVCCPTEHSCRSSVLSHFRGLSCFNCFESFSGPRRSLFKGHSGHCGDCPDGH